MEIVERLLKVGAKVNVGRKVVEGGARYQHRPWCSGGRTALAAAAGSGHLKVVERLVKEEADVNIGLTSYGGRIALAVAAEGAHRKVVYWLLWQGAIDPMS